MMTLAMAVGIEIVGIRRDVETRMFREQRGEEVGRQAAPTTAEVV
jgi:hypothetical protein